MIEREIIRSGSFSHSADDQHIAPLFDIRRVIRNRADVANARPLPMEHLPRIKRALEAEFRTRNPP